MHRANAKRRGFTLLEVIIALTMFGVIMAAVSFAVSAVLQASQRSQQRLDSSTDARGLLSFISRDIQSTMVSTTDPSSVFIGNGGDGASKSVGNMGALMFSTSLHRIDAPELDSAASESSPQPASANRQGISSPQSDVEMVRYEFDPETKVVARQHVNVPSLSLLSQQTILPETIIARNVLDFRLRFWDAEKRQWRSSWDFQQTNQKKKRSQGNGQGGSGDPNSSRGTELKGDDMLPSAVEVAITIAQVNAAPATYTTVIPIYMKQPLAAPPLTPAPSPAPSNGGNNNPPPNNGSNPNGGAPNTPGGGGSP